MAVSALMELCLMAVSALTAVLPVLAGDGYVGPVCQVLQTPELLLAFCGPTLLEQEDKAKQPPINDIALLQM